MSRSDGIDAGKNEGRRLTDASNPPTLLTDRLILRPHEAGDFTAAAAMWGDPDVVRFIGGATRSPQEVWFAILRGRGLWPIKGFGYWAIIERRTGEFLGEGGFADFRREITPDLSDFPEAGWAFAKSSWGRGIASEAVGAMHAWLDAERPGDSVCIIDAGNLASQAIAAKTGYGFWCEATLKGIPINLYKRAARIS